MELLNNLANGLRFAGGVLNPAVQGQLANELAAEAAAKRDTERALLAQRIADERERALSQAVAPALQGGDLQAAARAAIGSGAPGGVQMGVGLLDKHEARQTRAQQVAAELENKRQLLDQNFQLGLQRLTDAAERKRFEEDYKQRRLALDERQAEVLNGFKQQGLDIQKILADVRATAAANRVNPIVETADGIFERTPQGLVQLKGPDGNPLRPKAAGNVNIKQVTQLSGALDKAGLPESDAVIGSVEDVLAKNPNVAKYIAGPGSLIPDMAANKEVTDARQAFQKLFNITLKNRSGAAVTVPEFERLKAEFANGVWKKPEQLIEGVRQARNIINKHYASIAAGFGPDALKAYNENVREMGGRVVIDPQGNPTPSGAPAGKNVVVNY